MKQLKFKKLSEAAILPRKANPADAGFDITAIDKFYNSSVSCWEYSTGLAVEIPEGYVGLLFPRSSIYKIDLSLSNSVGVVDANYRGEVKFMFKETVMGEYSVGRRYNIGDRIGQLIVIPLPQFEPVFVDELDNTNDRGGGFGSSGA